MKHNFEAHEFDGSDRRQIEVVTYIISGDTKNNIEEFEFYWHLPLVSTLRHIGLCKTLVGLQQKKVDLMEQGRDILDILRLPGLNEKWHKSKKVSKCHKLDKLKRGDPVPLRKCLQPYDEAKGSCKFHCKIKSF